MWLGKKSSKQRVVYRDTHPSLTSHTSTLSTDPSTRIVPLPQSNECFNRECRNDVDKSTSGSSSAFKRYLEANVCEIINEKKVCKAVRITAQEFVSRFRKEKLAHVFSDSCEHEMTLYHYCKQPRSDIEGTTYTSGPIYTHSSPFWNWGGESNLKIILKWPPNFPFIRWCHYRTGLNSDNDIPISDEQMKSLGKYTVYVLPPCKWESEPSTVVGAVFLKPIFVFAPDTTDRHIQTLLNRRHAIDTFIQRAGERPHRGHENDESGEDDDWDD